MSSILREDQYFDNECEFCTVIGADAMNQLERVFLRNGISYFIKEKKRSIFQKLFRTDPLEMEFIVRINNKDVALATELAGEIAGIHVTGSVPAQDWSPKQKLSRMREQGSSERQVFFDDEEE